MVKITGVNFKEGGKVYYFAPGKDKYERGMGVVVETSRGLEYATVVIPFKEVEDDKIVSPLKPVVRIATQRDKDMVKKNIERRPEAMQIVQEKIKEHGLNMKLISCDFAFDGGKVVFYYSAPARVDFRELVKDLSATFKMRIELRQVGIRDEIKLVGGMGECGRECCCTAYMSELKKVSIKMAKAQNLSLNPSKISGLCGRLMCCLEYENDYYVEASQSAPKIGSEVGTPDGKGIVVNVNLLKMQVRVRIEDKDKDLFTYHDYPVDAIKFKKRADQNQDGGEEDSAEEKEEIEEQKPEPQNQEQRVQKQGQKQQQVQNQEQRQKQGQEQHQNQKQSQKHKKHFDKRNKKQKQPEKQTDNQ